MTRSPSGGAESTSRSFKAEQLIEAAFFTTDNPVFVVESGTRRILAINEAVTRVFGYTHDELHGQTTECLHVDRKSFQRFGELSERVLHSGHPGYRCFYRQKRKNGKVFDSENLVYIVGDDERQPLAAVSIVRDLKDPVATPLPTSEGPDFLALSDNLPGALFQCVRRSGGWEMNPHPLLQSKL